MGVRAPDVARRRLSATSYVDAASLDGEAAVPSVSDALGWTPERRAEARAESMARASALAGLLQDRYRFADFVRIRRSREWHLAVVRAVEGAQGVERARRQRTAREIASQHAEAQSGARVARLNRAHRCFVDAAKRLLSPDQYELIWDEAHADELKSDEAYDE